MYLSSWTYKVVKNIHVHIKSWLKYHARMHVESYVLYIYLSLYSIVPKDKGSKSKTQVQSTSSQPVTLPKSAGTLEQTRKQDATSISQSAPVKDTTKMTTLKSSLLKTHSSGPPKASDSGTHVLVTLLNSIIMY